MNTYFYCTRVVVFLLFFQYLEFTNLASNLKRIIVISTSTIIISSIIISIIIIIIIIKKSMHYFTQYYQNPKIM